LWPSDPDAESRSGSGFGKAKKKKKKDKQLCFEIVIFSLAGDVLYGSLGRKLKEDF
jgi:hypothetical protein